MKQDRGIVFRRVRGRIVPIRLRKEDKQNLSRGASLVAAGTAVGAAAGKVYRMVNSAATARSKKGMSAMDRAHTYKFRPGNQRQLTFTGLARQQKAQSLAMKSLKAGRRIGRLAAPIRLGGRFASAALIGVGAAKMYEGARREKLSTEKAAAIGGAAGIGAFLTGAFGGAGFRRAIKPAYIKAYPHIRKLKGLLKL